MKSFYGLNPNNTFSNREKIKLVLHLLGGKKKKSTKNVFTEAQSWISLLFLCYSTITLQSRQRKPCLSLLRTHLLLPRRLLRHTHAHKDCGAGLFPQVFLATLWIKIAFDPHIPVQRGWHCWATRHNHLSASRNT